jgi:hypothetical protein
MSYQLLGAPPPGSPPHYRGVYRCGPVYLDALPVNAAANLAWRRYVSELGEKVPTEATAVELADALAAAGQSFDIVHLDVCTDVPASMELESLLGFDVTMRGWFSLLSWGLHWEQETPPLGPLLKLIEAYFRPRLNEFGLFANWLDARRFLEVAQALAALSPGVWEAPGHEQMEIVRVGAVKRTDKSLSHPGGMEPQIARV